jgi:rare lipoprotein A
VRNILIPLLLTLATGATSSESEVKEGFATYYTIKSCQREGTSGVYTANGEKYNESAFTCALRSREWNVKYKVTNLDTGKSVIVRSNDFGPGKKATANGVIIDLTPAAFESLGGKQKAGKIRVKVERE